LLVFAFSIGTSVFTRDIGKESLSTRPGFYFCVIVSMCCLFSCGIYKVYRLVESVQAIVFLKVGLVAMSISLLFLSLVIDLKDESEIFLSLFALDFFIIAFFFISLSVLSDTLKNCKDKYPMFDESSITDRVYTIIFAFFFIGKNAVSILIQILTSITGKDAMILVLAILYFGLAGVYYWRDRNHERIEDNRELELVNK
jgi:hypothetical protein